jgi:hypothetical protein
LRRNGWIKCMQPTCRSPTRDNENLRISSTNTAWIPRKRSRVRALQAIHKVYIKLDSLSRGRTTTTTPRTTASVTAPPSPGTPAHTSPGARPRATGCPRPCHTRAAHRRRTQTVRTCAPSAPRNDDERGRTHSALRGDGLLNGFTISWFGDRNERSPPPIRLSRISTTCTPARRRCRARRRRRSAHSPAASARRRTSTPARAPTSGLLRVLVVVVVLAAAVLVAEAEDARGSAVPDADDEVVEDRDAALP